MPSSPERIQELNEKLAKLKSKQDADRVRLDEARAKLEELEKTEGDPIAEAKAQIAHEQEKKELWKKLLTVEKELEEMRAKKLAKAEPAPAVVTPTLPEPILKEADTVSNAKPETAEKIEKGLEPIIVDGDATPKLPTVHGKSFGNWKIIENKNSGKFELDLSKIEFHTLKKQEPGKELTAEQIQNELIKSSMTGFNASVMDAILDDKNSAFNLRLGEKFNTLRKNKWAMLVFPNTLYENSDNNMQRFRAMEFTGPQLLGGEESVEPEDITDMTAGDYYFAVLAENPKEKSVETKTEEAKYKPDQQVNIRRSDGKIESDWKIGGLLGVTAGQKIYTVYKGDGREGALKKDISEKELDELSLVKAISPAESPATSSRIEEKKIETDNTKKLETEPVFYMGTPLKNGEEAIFTANSKSVEQAEIRFEPGTGENKPNVQTENKSEEKLNRFGFPETWAQETSEKGLEEIQKATQGDNPINIGKLKAAIVKVLNQVDIEYAKYKGTNPQNFSGYPVNIDQPSELEHLKMTPEEKLTYFNKKWPAGLDITGTGKHLKWESILGSELWTLRNHNQTLATQQRGGGLDPYEIMIGMFALKPGGVDANRDSFRSGDLMKWIEENDMLMPEVKKAEMPVAPVQMESKEKKEEIMSEEMFRQEMREAFEKKIAGKAKIKEFQLDFVGNKITAHAELAIGVVFVKDPIIDIELIASGNTFAFASTPKIDAGSKTMNAATAATESMPAEALRVLEEKYGKKIKKIDIESKQLKISFE